jgi:hypothetical protein
MRVSFWVRVCVAAPLFVDLDVGGFVCLFAWACSLACLFVVLGRPCYLDIWLSERWSFDLFGRLFYGNFFLHEGAGCVIFHLLDYLLCIPFTLRPLPFNFISSVVVMVVTWELGAATVEILSFLGEGKGITAR